MKVQDLDDLDQRSKEFAHKAVYLVDPVYRGVFAPKNTGPYEVFSYEFPVVTIWKDGKLHRVNRDRCRPCYELRNQAPLSEVRRARPEPDEVLVEKKPERFKATGSSWTESVPCELVDGLPTDKPLRLLAGYDHVLRTVPADAYMAGRLNPVESLDDYLPLGEEVIPVEPIELLPEREANSELVEDEEPHWAIDRRPLRVRLPPVRFQ